VSAVQVLLVPGTTRIASEYLESLKSVRNIEIHGAGIDLKHPQITLFSSYHEVPKEINQHTLEKLVSLCIALKVDIVFPCHDDWIPFLSRYKSKIPSSIAAPSLFTAETCRSKRATYSVLSNKVTSPLIYTNVNDISTAEFPLFVKPDKGQGSKGTRTVENALEIEDFVDSFGKIKESFVCTSYLPGKEITVDCFTNRNRELVFLGPRARDFIREGLAVETHTLPSENLQDIAMRIQDSLRTSGAWFFQMKQSKKGEFALLEVANRIAGASGIHRSYGVNLGQMNYFHFLGHDVSSIINPEAVSVNIDYEKGIKYLRFLDRSFDQIFIDLDDTLLIRTSGDLHVNMDVLRFLNSARELGMGIQLVTKHSGDLAKTLRRFNLEQCFDEVHHLKQNDEKADYLNNFRQALFIDDSYTERAKVYKQFQEKIVVFDPSACKFRLET
jgi:hypothetical protein